MTNPTGSILVRRGPTADRLGFCPLQGEIIYDTDTDRFYIGNGTTFGGVSPTQSVFPDKGVMIKGTTSEQFLVAPGNLAVSAPPIQFLSFEKDTGNYSFTTISTAGPSITSLKLSGNNGLVVTRTDAVPTVANPTITSVGEVTIDVDASTLRTYLSLQHVTNESKATMFDSPIFTGTPVGIVPSHVGLNNVTNESKATMFDNPAFTGTVTGVTATHVGLGNVTNESKATMFTNPTFTGTVTGVTLAVASASQLGGVKVDASSITIDSSGIISVPAVATIGASNGIAQLGSDGKLVASQIPTSLSGAIVFKGIWNATTNIPILADGVGINGWQYAVSTGGTQNLGSGNITFVAGDYIIYNGTIWQRIPSSTIAEAGTLTGTTLNATVVNSSLTSVGTLTNLTVTNAITGSITGNAGTVTNGVVTTGTYVDPIWITSLAASKVGLGNVTNQSKATMFTSPTFTGTVTGVTATHVGLGNVTNQSKAIMFTSPTFTGTVTGVTATHVGLSNVENTALSTWSGSSSITTLGTVTVGSAPASDVYPWAKDATKPSYTATEVGLGNVTNESKATMFASPTFSGTVTLGAVSSVSITGGTNGYVLSTNGSGVLSWVAQSGGSSSNTFTTIAVAGQTSVAADTATDTLTLVAGTNVTITTDATTDAITINATSAGATTLDGLSDVAVTSATSGQILLYTGSNFVNYTSRLFHQFAYPATTALDVTVSGTIAYLFNNHYSGNNPTIIAISGTTIAFNLNVTGNPFLIRTSSGVNYNTGLVHVAVDGTVSTGSNAQGKVTGTLYWRIPAAATGNYQYKSSISAAMVGVITIQSSTSQTFAGTVTVQQLTEVTNTKSAATGVVDHDLSTGAIFFHSSIGANFTANFTNVPTTTNRTLAVVLVLSQGATAYLPTVVQIDGVQQNILWQGAVFPIGTPNQTDVVSFTLIRFGSWTILGSQAIYGNAVL